MTTQRTVVLLKVQRRRWLANLEPLVGNVAARQYVPVEMLDKLIVDYYGEHSGRSLNYPGTDV